MVRVTIEVWPFGKKEDSKVTHIIDVINDGTGTVKIGNYLYNITGEDGELIKRGTITRFRRKQGVLSLLSKILKKEV